MPFRTIVLFLTIASLFVAALLIFGGAPRPEGDGGVHLMPAVTGASPKKPPQHPPEQKIEPPPDFERAYFGPAKTTRFQLGAEAKLIGKAQYDAKSRTVIIEGTIKIRDTAGDPIELLAAAVNSEKLHETIIVCDVVPSDLHAALEAVGLKSWADGVSLKDEIKDIAGDKVGIWIEWAEGQTTLHERAEDMFLDTRFKRPWDRWGWAFVGSFGVIQDPQTGQPKRVYRPDVEKSLVVNYHSPNTVLDNPRAIGAIDDVYVTNTGFIPPIGTTVRMIFKPLTEAEIIGGNAAVAGHIVADINAYRDKLPADKKTLPEAVERLLKYCETRGKWLTDEATPIAKEIDALREKVNSELNPRLEKLRATLVEAKNQGADAEKTKQIIREGAAAQAALDEARAHVDLLYHKLWALVAQKERAEGKESKVDENAMALLERMVAYYKDGENLVTLRHDLSVADVEVLRLQDVIDKAAGEDALKAKREQIAARAKSGVLRQRIAREELLPNLRLSEQALAKIKEEMGSEEVKKDPELLASYKKEYDRELAEKEQIERLIKLADTRAQKAEVDGKMRLAELAGAADPQLKSEMEKIERQEKELLLRVELHELTKQLKDVEWRLRLAIESRDKDEVIARIRKEREDILGRVEIIKKELGE